LALACLTLLALFTAWTSLSFAQGGVGTINGTITDPKGLSVPGAAVLIHNTDTNIDRTVTTTDAGLYTATFLPSGHYEVTASKEGFAKQLRKELTLQVGQTLTIDFAMVIQAAESVITVSGEAPVLERDRDPAALHAVDAGDPHAQNVTASRSQGLCGRAPLVSGLCGLTRGER